MDNIRNNNTSSQIDPSVRKIRSKILPIHIVKKDSNDTNILDKKKVNFQVNFGNVYRINYKYFTPKGYHLSKNSTPEFTCRYNNNGLSRNSITFIYDKNTASRPQPKNQAKPIQVNYIDINTSKKVKTGLTHGKYGQSVNVLDQVTIPSGYILCQGQMSTFKVNGQNQSIDLMVRRIPSAKDNQTQSQSKVKPKSAANRSNHTNGHDNNKHGSSDPISTHLTGNIKKNVATLETDLRKYDCDLAVQLIHELLHHNLDFFKKVIVELFSKLKYKDINNLKVSPKERKISGVIKKYLFNNNQVNFTFIRAKKYDIHHQITVSEVRDFVTSVIDHNSSKGVFITTSHFSSAAHKEAKRHSIILVDNMRLARLMIQNNVGVKPQRIFRVVNLDKDFF